MFDFLRATIKVPFVTFAIISYFVSGGIGWVLIRDQYKRKLFYSKNVTFFVRIGLWFFNIKVTAKNLPKEDQNFLIVGNHQGFLDILIASSVKSSLYITSVEIRKTPLLGQFCEVGGCFFVERRNRSNIQNEINEIRASLKKGLSVTLYPEGTSSDGSKILPFKKSLLTAAAGTGVPIKPVVINFRKVNNSPMSHQWRDYVCWYGDLTFGPALWRLLIVRNIEVEIEYLDEISVHNDEDRREVALKTYEMISQKFTVIPYPEAY